MMAKGVYENQRKTRPDQRVFLLTRSAYAGQQRYAAATWSGDVASRWEDLKAQIPAGLNFCLSGIPYWTTDIGGFAPESRYEHPDSADLEEWRELNTRWFQFATFCPLFRSHGQFPLREMFNMAPADHPAYQTMLAYDRLRYRLKPYIYSLAGMVSRDGYTVMRALPMDFPHDRRVYGIADQYMFGPALLVNPVTEYRARSRPVYLPTGSKWYDLRTGQRYEGGSTIMAKALYTDMPLFARAGSIIPCGPAIQYTGQKADPLRIFVFGGARGSFTLYEDEEVNYNCEKGAFSLIPFDYDDSTGTLHIGARAGSFPSMLGTRTIEVVLISPGREGGLNFERTPDATVTYEGSPLTVPISQK
jgi:alpha-D-xyloside xylohydrolase